MREAHPLHRLIWPVLGVLTVVTYNTWVFWDPVNGQARILNGYLSELSASDQPGNVLFRAGDLITALLVGALALRGATVWRGYRHRRWWMIVAVALAVFAVATFFDALLALDCAPTVNLRCRIAEERGQLSLAHYAHTYTSVLANTGILVSMGAGYIAVRRSRPDAVGRRRALFAACLIAVVSTGVMLVMIAVGLAWWGYPQAVQVLVASIWFAAVGFGVLGAPRSARPRSARDAMRVQEPIPDSRNGALDDR